MSRYASSEIEASGASVDKKLARADAARKKAALACAKALAKASDELHAFVRACNAVGDASAYRGPDDGRTLLASRCDEYANYLESVYDK